VAEARVPVATHREGPDRVEHDPDELLASLRVAAQDVCDSAAARGREIVAAGLACQRSTVVCWDRYGGRTLSAAISWQDRRDAGFLEQLRPQAGWVRERTGLVLSPHYGANKLRWCLEMLPAVRAAATAATARRGSVVELSALRSARGAARVRRPVERRPDAAVRPATQTWVPELLAAFGIPASVLPRPVPTVHGYGTLRVGERRIPLMACTGDQAAAVFAHGELEPDRACSTPAPGRSCSEPSPPPRGPPTGCSRACFFSNGSRVVCSLEGTINGAASALDWLQARVALDVPRAVHALHGRAPARAPIFMNGVGGLGSPWWKPDFPVEFCGEGEELARVTAVVESLAFMICVNLELMRERDRSHRW
jgi:glycerol kinase